MKFWAHVLHFAVECSFTKKRGTMEITFKESPIYEAPLAVLEGKKQMMERIIKVTLLIFFIVFTVGNAGAISTNELTDKLAFLKKGDVWIANQNGKEMKQITKTNGKVEDFLFSPSLKYLAYSKILKYVDEPGLWEKGEEAPKRAVCSIVIVDIEKQKVVKEITPKDNWIYPSKWLPGERLFCYESSGFDISGFFEYDLRRGMQREVDYQEGNQLFEADFYRDGSYMLYIDDRGFGKGFKQNLHLVDLKSKDDRVILSKRSVLEPKISEDKKNIAFVEVESEGKEYFDNLWIYTFKDGSVRRIYRGRAKAKAAGVNELSWSFDGKYVGMFFSPEALVIEVQSPTNMHKIQGADFNWVTNNKIIFSQGNNIYSYGLDTRKKELIIKDTSKPKFL
jgi:Tol biopolymer transport system component